jgi:hypothetical protein
MKRFVCHSLLALVGALALAFPAWAATPTLFYYRATSDYFNSGVGASVFHTPLPDHQVGHPGNCILYAFRVDNTGGTHAISSVTDTAGNTYTQAKAITGGLNSDYYLYHADNINSTANKEIKVTFTTASATFFESIAAEYYNTTTTPIDGTAQGQTTATGVAHNAGTAVGANGDLVVSFAFYGDGLPYLGTTITKDTTAGTVLNTVDLGEGSASQQVAATAAVNPAFTWSPDPSVCVLAIALLPGTTGTAPGTGIRIIGIQDYASAKSISSFVVQWPTSRGNLLIANWSGEDVSQTVFSNITAITDTPGNTWVSRVTQNGNPNGGASKTDSSEQILDTGNATTTTSQTNKLTVTLANASNATFPNVLQLYEVANAAASPFDATAAGQKTDNNAAAWTFDSVSITPTTANGLIIYCENQFGGTAEGSTESAGAGVHNFDAPWALQADGGGTLFAEDRAFAHTYNSDSGVAHTWRIGPGSATAPGGWVAVAAAYKGAAAATATPTRTLLGVGQ